tara:strand:- start:28061 stop:29113 length:1053 start_codon:yes stop_codon:yes gene_type:complete
MKVLLCDENLEAKKELIQHLSDLGHECILAESGAKSIELLTADEPDLIILDFDISDMCGIKVTRKLKEFCYNISSWVPIILMSRDASVDNIVAALNAGADDFIQKPISFELIKAKISALRRIVSLKENLIDFGNQLQDLNEKLVTSNQLLSTLSLKDPLTLLANRRAFEEGLERTCRMALRNKTSTSLIMIDIDHFKPYNDTYGHQAGDICLKEVAQTIKTSLLRDKDIAARYGGEEFSLILPDTSKEDAMLVGERVRSNIEALCLKNVGSPKGYVSVSLGVSCAPPNIDFVSESLVAAADDALYRAKEQGRNTVVASILEVNNKKPGHHLSSYKTLKVNPNNEENKPLE